MIKRNPRAMTRVQQIRHYNNLPPSWRNRWDRLVLFRQHKVPRWLIKQTQISIIVALKHLPPDHPEIRALKQKYLPEMVVAMKTVALPFSRWELDQIYEALVEKADRVFKSMPLYSKNISQLAEAINRCESMPRKRIN